MKRFLIGLGLLFGLCSMGFGQLGLQGYSQQWTQYITGPPPALLANQTFSTSTNTGFTTSTSGGSIAAGTYRCGVTYFTSSNTESPLSTDSATTSTITTTGSTSTVTIQAPNTSGVTSNVVGWRPYCGVSGGASGAETLVTINNTVCTLSTSSTASCSLQSAATLTLQSQFAGGSGGPATPGTAVFPPISNSANQFIFENSTQTYRVVYWVVSGTAPSACTFTFQTGSTVAGLTSVASGSGGQTVTCTSSGSFALPNTGTAVYSAINIATYTAGDLTTKVAFYYLTAPFNPQGNFYFGNATPTSTCPTGSMYQSTGGGESTTLYGCNSGTWTAVTVP